MLGNTGCSPFQQAEFDLSGVSEGEARVSCRYSYGSAVSAPSLAAALFRTSSDTLTAPRDTSRSRWYWRNAAHLLNFEFYMPPHHPKALKMSKKMQNTQGNQISISRQKFEFYFFTPKFGGLESKIGLFTLSPIFHMPK